MFQDGIYSENSSYIWLSSELQKTRHFGRRLTSIEVLELACSWYSQHCSDGRKASLRIICFRDAVCQGKSVGLGSQCGSKCQGL